MIKVLAILLVILNVLGILGAFHAIDKPRKPLTLDTAIFGFFVSAVSVYLLVRAYL